MSRRSDPVRGLTIIFFPLPKFLENLRSSRSETVRPNHGQINHHLHTALTSFLRGLLHACPGACTITGTPGGSKLFVLFFVPGFHLLLAAARSNHAAWFRPKPSRLTLVVTAAPVKAIPQHTPRLRKPHR